VFAILGVALGTAALATVMSVTGGFRAEFRDKVLGVNAHVMVLRASFRDYREVMEKVRRLPEVSGIAPRRELLDGHVPIGVAGQSVDHLDAHPVVIERRVLREPAEVRGRLDEPPQDLVTVDLPETRRALHRADRRSTTVVEPIEPNRCDREVERR